MLRKLYLSPFGILISIIQYAISFFGFKFMVYGYVNIKERKFFKHTRIASTAILTNKKNINISDHVWIGHYGVLDGIGGICIGEGVNISSHICIYTHSSHDSIRLLGRTYIEIPATDRIGYHIGAVSIGDFTFIGTSSVILPGVKIGKGCIIGAGCVVNKDIPDFSIAAGNPVRIIGDSRKRDEKYLTRKGIDKNYYLNISK